MSLFKRSGYWQHVRPVGMIADFIAVWKQAGNNRWRIAAVAAVCTFGVFYVMANQGGRAPHPPPEVTYITSWRADRSDYDVRRDWLQRARDANARNRRRRDAYGAFARTLGQGYDAAGAQDEFDAALADIAAMEREVDVAERERRPIRTIAELRAAGLAPPEQPAPIPAQRPRP